MGLDLPECSEPQCGDNVMYERVPGSTSQSDMDSQSLPTPVTQPQSEELPNNNVGEFFFTC